MAHPGDAPPPSPARLGGNERLLIALSLGIVAILGVIHLPHPFSNDQALFLYGAKLLDAGERLYVEYWDNKQPGLYTFYLTGGRLFGFSETGVHLLELITLLVLGAIAAWSFRDWLRDRRLAALIPLATVGAYYSAADTRFMTELEILIGLPLLVTLVLVARPDASARHWFFAGLAGAAAVWLKLLLATLPATIWAVALWFEWRHDRCAPRRLVSQRIAPLVSGLVLGLGLIAVHAYIRGNLAGLLWTSFVYPFQAVGQIEPTDVHTLLRAVRWWLIRFAPWILLAVIALVPLRSSLRDRRTAMLLGWTLVALVMISVQVYSWWPYHFLLLVVPVGILAVRGMDRLLAAVRERSTPSETGMKMVTALAILAATVPGLLFWLPKARHFTASLLDGDLAKPGVYQSLMSVPYRYYARDGAFLNEADAKPGTIYVLGSPLYLLLSGRKAAIPTNGWSWAKLVPSQLERIPRELAAAAPAYVYITREMAVVVSRCCAAIPEWLGREYSTLKADRQGTWFVRRE
jgi:hypothetical protein